MKRNIEYLVNYMSFDRNYAKRKDWRKPYYGSKEFDRSCRHKGNCGFCNPKKRYKDRKFELEEKDKLNY